MSRKKYGIIEHTADIGISVSSDDLRGLFKDAGLAMFDIIAQAKNVRAGTERQKTLKISLSAFDKEELFINWLNELLSLSATKRLIFKHIKISRLTDNIIEAEASGSDHAGFRLKKEIKAATYHGLKIVKKGKRFHAEVIFDV